MRSIEPSTTGAIACTLVSTKRTRERFFATPDEAQSHPLPRLGINALSARLGGDEFGIIGLNCDKAAGEALRARVDRSLRALGVNASVGLAMANVANTICAPMTQADKQMYQQKRLKKSDEPKMVARERLAPETGF